MSEHTPRWICVDCGGDLPPGTAEHCGQPTDHEETCEACGELYMVQSDKCLTQMRGELRDLREAARAAVALVERNASCCRGFFTSPNHERDCAIGRLAALLPDAQPQEPTP